MQQCFNNSRGAMQYKNSMVSCFVVEIVMLSEVVG